MGPLPITWLTLRQMRRSKSLFVVAGVYAFAVLFSMLHFIPSNTQRIQILRSDFGQVIYLDIVVATLLPLATVILATSVFGDEIEDKTLQYLFMKPVSRLRIVLEKLLAALLVAVPVAWIMLMIAWVVQFWGKTDQATDFIWPLLISSLVGILGFGSLFMLISMVIQRALLVGIFYVFVWETALSRFLPGIKLMSIRHYTQSLFVRMLDDRRVDISGPSASSTIYITITVLVVVCVGLATWRLRSLNLE